MRPLSFILLGLLVGGAASAIASGQSFTRIVLTDDTGWSEGGNWIDYDGDEDLDLFIPNNPNVNGVDFLYDNNGDGTFSKVTTGPPVTTPTRSFGVAWADYDRDGDVDLFVANSSGNNLLYRNEGGGRFTRMTAAAVGQLVAEGGSIAVSWGDYDNDGYPDVFVTNFQRNDYLYRNDGDGTFTKVTTGPVVTSGGVGEGSAWADYDNDGDLDLFVANGGPIEDVNFLFRNQRMETGTASFVRVTANEAGTIASDRGCFAGAMWGDYDNDGDVDLFVSNFNGKNSFIYRNETAGNHWINIRARGTLSNRSAIGARVGVKATIQGAPTWQWREVAGQTGYNAQNSLRAHFGLADAALVDSLVVHWPSGMVDVFTSLAADQFLVATEGQTASPVATEDETPVPQQVVVESNYPNPFDATTRIRFALPEARFVTLRVYDVLGRAVATLVAGRRAAGRHEATFDGRAGPSGPYVYVLEAGAARQTGTMLLMR